MSDLTVLIFIVAATIVGFGLIFAVLYTRYPRTYAQDQSASLSGNSEKSLDSDPEGE